MNNDGVSEGVFDGVKKINLNQKIKVMETTVKNHKQMINAKSANDLEAGIIAALPKILDYARKQDYVIKNDDGFLQITNNQLLDSIKNASLKKRKVLRNYLWLVDKFPTMATINKFLHFLMTKILKSETRYKLLKSEKQLKIEEKKAKYNEAVAAMQKAYAEYKAEKGDFYNLRKANGQRIE
jgi:hypothetical protein